MPQGFQVFDASGNVVVDVTTRITRYLATANIAWNDYSLHSFSHDGFLTGTPFAMVDNQNNAFSSITNKSQLRTWVDISISGTICMYQQKLNTGVDPVYARAHKDIILNFGVY